MSADAQPPIEAQGQSGSGLAGLLGSVISAGKGILARRRQAAAEAPSGDLLAKCQQLLHHRGEASGLALACEVMADYQALDDANQTLFLRRWAMLSIPTLQRSLPPPMPTKQIRPLSN